MISPVIQFHGNCIEAIRYYESVFGANVIHIDYNREAPDNSGIMKTAEMNNLVMHSDILICGTHFSMSDTLEECNPGTMFRFNVFMESEDAVKEAYNKLSEKGTVVVELGPQFFTPMYGSVIDCYGIHWQLIMYGGESEESL